MDADGGDGHGDGGGGGERGAVVMKKGPWTAAEDAVLIEFVSKHGEGNWNGVTRNSGLKRCGKSCRLRWANHLRPNLKKCAFTHEEERAIIQLHAKFGNKWARMASQLPGRTDNEIKNYWNTRTKRRQRAGLPIYPQETQRKVGGFHLQQQQKHKQDRHHHQGIEQQHQPHSSSCSIASLLPSSATGHPAQNPAYNRRRFSLFESIRTSSPPNPIQTHPSSSFFPNPNRQFNFFPSTYNNGFALPLSPVSPVSSKSPISPFPSLSPSLFNQSFTSLLQAATPPPPLPPPPLHINPHNVEFNSSNTTMRDQFEPTELTLLLEMELPSSQTPMQPLTPASSATSGPPPPSNTTADDYVLETFFPQKNTGLLGDMLKESHTISRNNANNSKGDEMTALSNKGEDLMDDDFMFDATTTSELEQFYGEGNETIDLFEYLSYVHSSVGELLMQAFD